MASQEEQALQQSILQARERQLQVLAARQLQLQQQQQQQRGMGGVNQMGNQMGQQMGQQTAQTQPRIMGTMGTMGMSMAPTMGSSMGTSYDDIPITEPNDLQLFSGQPVSQPDFASFQAACRDGSLSTIGSIITSKPRTPAFLHQGLILALGSGKVDAARRLLEAGAPIARQTPTHILSAPEDQKIPLFELLTQHGWTTNTPGFYGAVLLPRVVTNDALLDWFLAHGADPNLGAQRDNRDRNGAPDADSCVALETAASHGTAEAVQKLLSAGAQMRNGAPLYFAAGVCPAGANPHAGPVTPSREIDAGRIPVMAQLVENGADVNQKLESRHMNPQYPIVNAVMAGAVERVKWLLSQGADPDLRGAFGSATQYAERMGSDEMKRILQEERRG
ncbi:ankyrin repeat-containing domain protein [Ilyonectria robusta]|uniref:ankyrin repeat-containing domain protein n=1 Tax=Ilyonectria robusta TaxID=1079257 RepID=UPI001E8DDDD7|nr:ankyrin repeat-containing domain protein [Ilyonectria robusta]KAH8686197.1 ankyrin repeat-containing domain protein [Ilyonectria robusta]